MRRTLNFNLYDLEYCTVGKGRVGIENEEGIANDVKGKFADKGPRDF